VDEDPRIDHSRGLSCLARVHGERRTGTITILFTDLVGSTEVMERAGEDEGRELLGHHLRLLREVSNAYSGQEVKNLGDGFEVAFSSVVAALSAATTMQRTIHWENRVGLAAMGLRVGMNVCEASVEAGDYWGLSVVIAKRLCDMAMGGQILVSGLVRDLATHHKEWRFDYLGERHVKGISQSVNTYELEWAPLDHAPTLPLSPTSDTPEHRVMSRFLRSVRRAQSDPQAP
jgi:class 3 adenylate cyclase